MKKGESLSKQEQIYFLRDFLEPLLVDFFLVPPPLDLLLVDLLLLDLPLLVDLLTDLPLRPSLLSFPASMSCS